MGVYTVVFTVMNNMRIPIPTYNEPELEKLEFTKALGPDNAWVKWYLDCPTVEMWVWYYKFRQEQFCARDVCKKSIDHMMVRGEQLRRLR